MDNRLRSGPVPFGYTRVGGMLVREPPEAHVRENIFSLFVRCGRRSVVAEILNAEGHRTRSGTLFSTQTVGRILSDSIVLGIPGEVEQIVGQELWDRCQDILAEQNAAGGAKRAPRHLFAGLLFCLCGQKMYVPSSSNKYVCSDCRAKIVSDDLERIFVQQAGEANLSNTIITLIDGWNILPFETKRETIEAICERIEVNDKSITIHFADL